MIGFTQLLHLALECRPLALQALVNEAFDLLRPLASQQGVVLRNEVGIDAMVVADAQRTRQVLINVVARAIGCNRPGGWVRVSMLAPEGGRVVLSIEDTGAGLSPAQMARLFEPFERLGRESSADQDSGLGLVIARRLAQAMGGELSLCARAGGVGTVAQVALPQARPEGPEPAPQDSTTATAATTARDSGSTPAALRVLYVEDNRINAILFEEAMRMHGGIELRVAEDGAEALELALAWTPEVLVLDAHLPDMSGYEVLERMRALPALAGVPAYMCSADALEGDLQRARLAGFAGYWTKPIDIARVLSDLQALLPAPGAASSPRGSA